VFWEVTRHCWSHGLSPWPIWRSLFVSPYVPEAIKRRLRALRAGGRVPRWPDWLPEHTRVRLGVSPRGHPVPKGLNLPQRLIYDRAVNGMIRPVLDTYSTSMGALGVEVRHPFLDRSVAELVFAAPVELWMRDGWPKWLLRQATEGLLPDSVRWRRDKTAASAYLAAGLEQNRAWVEEVLSDADLQEHGLIHNAALLSRFRSASMSGFRTGLHEIAWPLATQAWFQHCRGAFGVLHLGGERS
jgi:asparagine synthetase B (glutamine-hydrolysing)